MKIIIDCRKICDSGIGTYIINTIPGIIKKILNIHDAKLSVLVNISDIELVSKIFPSGTNFILTKHKNFSLMEQIFLCRILDKNTFFWATSLSHPIFIRKNLLITTVYDLIPVSFKHRSRLERVIFNFLYFNLSRKSILILFISFFTKNQFINKYGYSGKSAVTYLGVDEDWFVNVVKKDNYIISYCNLKHHKNIRKLLESFILLAPKYDSRLLLILNKEVRDLDRDIIEISMNHPSISIESNLDKSDLIYKVSHARCLVVPSLYEGFGLTVLEGMACGCPVLASNVTAIPEVGNNSITYFDPYLKDDLLHKLDHFLRDQAFNSKILDGAKLRARQFTWDKCIEDTYIAIEPTLINS